MQIIRSSKPDPGFLPDATWQANKRVRLGGPATREGHWERPLPGIAHAFVFWGFLAFALVSFNHVAEWVRTLVIQGRQHIWQLLLRSCGTLRDARVLFDDRAWNPAFHRSAKVARQGVAESGIITILILLLMVTYLFGYGALREGTPAAPVNWWIAHAGVTYIPAFNSSHQAPTSASESGNGLSVERSFSRIPPLVGDEDFGLIRARILPTSSRSRHSPVSSADGVRSTVRQIIRVSSLIRSKMILGVREYLRDHGANGAEPIVGQVHSREDAMAMHVLRRL